jgi:hypothetical protein
VSTRAVGTAPAQRPGRRSRRGGASALAALVLTLALSGCAGYRLGPTNGLQAGQRSVQFIPFFNKTLEPRLSDDLNLQLRKQLQRDGTFRLATQGDGDIVVSGVITRFDRLAISFNPADVLTVQDFRLRMTAQVVTLDRSTGASKTNLCEGFTLMRVGNDLTSSERQALPLVAAELARNVTAMLAEGSW